MKITFKKTLLGCLILFLNSCSISEPSRSEEEQRNVDNRAFSSAMETPERVDEFKLAKGADISWLTEMEALGYKFYYDNGNEGDCLEILQSKGVNAVRLRVWVNPANGYCGVEDVVIKAKRASEMGMDVMIDFHYSDVWADPSAQTTPSEWKDYDIDRLTEAVSSFTTSTLSRLVEEGANIKWVQIGNETGNGMLWPLGQADKYPENYARLTQAGVDAVRTIIPDAKTIVHLQSGENGSLAKWLLGILKKYDVSYDIAGFSLYPEWNNFEEFISKAQSTMEMVIRDFDKDVALCEVGMDYKYQNQSYKFLTLAFDLSKKIPDNRYHGLFYWEPEAYNNFNGYTKGAFLTNGRPSKAMDAFSFTDSGVRPVYSD